MYGCDLALGGIASMQTKPTSTTVLTAKALGQEYRRYRANGTTADFFMKYNKQPVTFSGPFDSDTLVDPIGNGNQVLVLYFSTGLPEISISGLTSKFSCQLKVGDTVSGLHRGQTLIVQGPLEPASADLTMAGDLAFTDCRVLHR